MDSGKLLRILKDLKLEEEDLRINPLLDEIKNLFSQNTPEANLEAGKKLSDFISVCESSSEIGTYSSTELDILKSINGSTYFGNGLCLKLKSISRQPSYSLVPQLNELISSRQEFLNKINQLIESFSNIGIVEWRPDNFEIGITIPEDLAEISDVSKYLESFDRLISAVVEATKGKSAPVKINRLSNGSICLFSPQDAEIAIKFAGLIADLLTIIVLTKQLNAERQKNETDSNISEDGRKEITKAYDNELNRIRTRIITELPNKIFQSLKLKEGRSNEIRTKIEFGISDFYEWIQKGIKLDITPNRRNDISDDSDDNNEIKIIKEVNMELGKIYNLPPEQRKLPFSIPTGAEIQKASK